MKEKWVSRFVISTFVVLYAIVSIISTIHVIDFFELSNPYWLAVSLAIAFEFGAAASLASLVALDKMNKGIVWALFFAITAMQMQGNMYYAFTNLHDFQSWIELFNLQEWEPLAQKRVLAFVSGAILPLVALGFIKSLVDYIKPEDRVVMVEEPKEGVSIDEELKAYENLREDAEETKTSEEIVANLDQDVIDEILNGEEFEVEEDDIFDVIEENAEKMKEEELEKIEKDFEAGRNLFKESVSSLNKSLKDKGEVSTPTPGLINRKEETQRIVSNKTKLGGPGLMGAID
jgi:hypothetical protein